MFIACLLCAHKPALSHFLSSGDLGQMCDWCQFLKLKYTILMQINDIFSIEIYRGFAVYQVNLGSQLV